MQVEIQIVIKILRPETIFYDQHLTIGAYYLFTREFGGGVNAI